MIYLNSSYFNESIKIKEYYLNCINISNKYQLINFTNELISNKIKIFIDEKVLDFSKIEIMYNIFNIDFNKKELIDKLYNSLENELNIQKEYKIEFDRYLNNFISTLKFNSIFEFEFEDNFKYKNLFKLLDIKNKDYSVNIKDKFINYIDLLGKFNYKLIFTFNLDSYFDINDLNDINNELKYKEITLVNIENKILIDELEKYINLNLIYYDKDMDYIL